MLTLCQRRSQVRQVYSIILNTYKFMKIFMHLYAFNLANSSDIMIMLKDHEGTSSRVQIMDLPIN